MESTKHKNKKPLSFIFTFSIFVVFLGMFLTFFLILWFSMGENLKVTAGTTMELSINDTKNDISDTSDFNMLTKTKTITETIGEHENPDNAYLESLCIEYDATSISIISHDGVITTSSNYGQNGEESYIGFNMYSGTQSAEFMTIVNDGVDSYVQAYQPTSQDSSISMKYAAYKYNDGFVQIGYDAEQFQSILKSEIADFTQNLHIGSTGYLIIINNQDEIVSDRKEHCASILSETGLTHDALAGYEEGKLFSYKVYGADSYVIKGSTEGYTIIAVMPVHEVLTARGTAMLLAGIIEGVIFILLAILTYILLKKIVVRNINKINIGLSEITSGNLDTVIDVRNTSEFDKLSSDINSTVDTLKVLIKQAEEKNAAELEFAKEIQSSALPQVFPAYPNRPEFDIYAGMKTAKEVGGDFYDFYFVSQDTIAFLIADVSGKGIPAAMFMMEAKTIIKSYAETGMPINEVLTKANDKLCENNKAEMFVTCWMGALNLHTGKLTYANAGHNMPLIKTGKNEFIYLKGKRKMPLATWEGMEYPLNEMTLAPGDKIYLYTDGVTEATNSEKQLYGDDKLKNLLNSEGTSFLSCEELCHMVFESVDIFQGEADQFDDITMLSIEYKCYSTDAVSKELQLSATLKNISVVTQFVESELKKYNCPKKALAQINIAIDELFSSLAKMNESETAKVKLFINNNPLSVHITFTEEGVPYNPLTKKAQNIGIDSTDEDLDALGLLFVKKSMDEITYEYKDGENILTIKKNL